MKHLPLILAIVIALAAPAAVQAQVTPDRPTPPEQAPHLVILSAQPDAANIILHVEGRNFCSSPVVTFGGQPLAVAGTGSSTSFDALLPVGVQPGTYLLEVSCGKGAVRNDEFIVTILPAPAE